MQNGFTYIKNQFIIILLVACLCFIFLALGLMLGYSFFGQGKNPLEILSFDKWQSIFEKFTG